ncbi:MAG: hypothetical protein JSW65_00470 [Candidatus Bipolaricaulota bacterium]|nr:MAG: hypothetical protein JSW65_00470 [Candidatus Bipolaricaulota bacterium]
MMDDEERDWEVGDLGDVADRVGLPIDDTPVLSDILDEMLDRMEVEEGPPLAAWCFVDITSVRYDSSTDTLTVEARTLPRIDCMIEAQTGYFTSDIVQDFVRSDAVGRVTWSTTGISLRITDRAWVEVTAKPYSTYECSDTETYATYEIEMP